MAEPTSAASMTNLMVRTAEFAGLAYYSTTGDSKALAPVDKHDHDLIKRIVNEGLSRFIDDAPEVGWRWRKRMQLVNTSITTNSTATSGSATTLVDSGLAATYADDYYNDAIIEITGGTGQGEFALVTDYTGASGTFIFSALSGGSTPDTTTTYIVGHRYKLSDDFGAVDGPPTYLHATNIGTPIIWTHEGEIRLLNENNSLQTGFPFRAAVRPFGTRQHELLLHPPPHTVETIQFPYIVLHNDLQFETGVATGGNATTLVDSARVEADDAFNTWILTVVAGPGEGETATITDYTGSSGTFTFSALSGGSTPDTTSVYNIEPASGNTHPAGAFFDAAVRSACLAQAESIIDDLNGGKMDEYQNISILQAHRNDARLAPRSVGNMNTGKMMTRMSHINRQNVTYTP